MFGDIIRELRISRGLLQRFVAEKLGMSASRLTRLENNTYEPDLDTIRKLCKFYGTSADGLLEITPTVGTQVSKEQLWLLTKLKDLPLEYYEEIGEFIDFKISRSKQHRE